MYHNLFNFIKRQRGCVQPFWSRLFFFLSILEVSLLSFRFKVATRCCSVEALKILFLNSEPCWVWYHLGWSPILLPCPVRTQLFHVWICIQEVEIMSLTPPLPFLANQHPVNDSNCFHPPPSPSQLLTLHHPGWELQVLEDGPQGLFQTELVGGAIVQFD